MGLGALFLLALSVSMDAFAVSMCKGLAIKKAGLRQCLTCGLWFGGFQALMPLAGYFLGTLFATAIEAFDHCENQNDDMSFKTMFIMAIATSIDALAVGISLAMTGVPVQGEGNIFFTVILIGLTTGLFSGMGVKIGNIFGSRYEKKAQVAGGVILILLGIKILLEHLGVLV